MTPCVAVYTWPVAVTRASIVDDDRSKVVHAGQRRPRHHRIPLRLKGPMPVIAVQARARVEAQRPGALDGMACDVARILWCGFGTKGARRGNRCRQGTKCDGSGKTSPKAAPFANARSRKIVRLFHRPRPGCKTGSPRNDVRSSPMAAAPGASAAALAGPGGHRCGTGRGIGAGIRRTRHGPGGGSGGRTHRPGPRDAGLARTPLRRVGGHGSAAPPGLATRHGRTPQRLVDALGGLAHRTHPQQR